jgi:biopolymer transport protein ExbD
MAGIFLLLSICLLVNAKCRTHTAIILEQPPLDTPIFCTLSSHLALLIDSTGKVYAYPSEAPNPAWDLNAPHEVAKLKAHLAEIKLEDGRQKYKNAWALRVIICPHEQARYKHVITLLNILHQENIVRHKIGAFRAHHAHFLRTGERIDDTKIQTIKFIPPEPITE